MQFKCNNTLALRILSFQMTCCIVTLYTSSGIDTPWRWLWTVAETCRSTLTFSNECEWLVMNLFIFPDNFCKTLPPNLVPINKLASKMSPVFTFKRPHYQWSRSTREDSYGVLECCELTSRLKHGLSSLPQFHQTNINRPWLRAFSPFKFPTHYASSHSAVCN